MHSLPVWLRAIAGAASLAALLLVSTAQAADTQIERQVRGVIEEGVVTALLLTDGETVRLGFLNFDPNELLPVEDEQLGTDSAVAQRDKLGFLSLPLRWKLRTQYPMDDVSAGVRASYMEEREEVYLADPDAGVRDETRTTHTIGSADIRWRHNLSARWKVDSGLAAHFVHVSTSARYNSEASQQLAPKLDGLVTNYSTNTWVVAPSVGVRHWRGTNADRLEYFSVLTYHKGGSVKPDRAAHDVSPEAWFWSNGVEKKFPLTRGKYAQSVMTRLARVDVGGDLSGPVGSNAYYELGVGWYSALPEAVPFVDNAGLVLNFNYGSTFRGGTVGFLLNVK